MTLPRMILAICLILFVNPLIAAETIPALRPIPTGSVILLGDNPLATFGVQSEFSEYGEANLIDMPGTPTGKVLRLELNTVPKVWWHAQAKWKTKVALPAGRAALIRILMRATAGQTETAAGKVEIMMQQTSAPWNGPAAAVYPPLPVEQWKWIDIPLVSPSDYSGGALALLVNFGYFQQTLEIADVQVYMFDKKIKAGDLPQPDYYTYQGREADAPWRAAAEARIEKYRKGDLVVRVVDAAGQTVSGASVAVRMKKHAFLFGTTYQNLFRQDTDGERYRAAIKENFNLVVPEGSMKWVDMAWTGNWKPDARKRTEEEQQRMIAGILREIDWYDANGIKVRGHNLIWPGWGHQWPNLPPYLKPMVEAGDKEGVRREIENRIRTATAAFRGRVIEWDVVNESVSNHALQDFLGRDEQVKWYKLAKQCDPTVPMVINDYQMLSGGAIPSRTNAYYDEIKFLLEHGAPIDAIAEQGHFNWQLPGMEQTWKILERFAAFGKPMRITEFDVAITDEKLQADFTRDFYTLIFSHPQMEQILMWGFWEGTHWMPSAAMYRKNWATKPNYTAYRELVFKKWWTRADSKTDASGQIQTRGFLGDYEITATNGQQRGSATVSLDRNGLTVTIQLR